MPKPCSKNCGKSHSSKTRTECKDCFHKMTSDQRDFTTTVIHSGISPIFSNASTLQLSETFSQYQPEFAQPQSTSSLFRSYNTRPRNPPPLPPQQQQPQLSFAGLPQSDANTVDGPVSFNEARLVTLMQHAMKPLEAKLDQIHNELTNRVMSLEKRVDLIEKCDEIKTDEVYRIKNTMVNMQRALNSIDSADRSKNIIISGISEEVITIEGNNFDNDYDKLKYIFAKISIDENLVPIPEKIQRLGKDVNNSKRRYIKAEFENNEVREVVMKEAFRLKDLPEPWKRIYLNRDTHPVYQKESQRLRKKFNDLKKDPQHQQNPESVKLVKGILSVNDITVDKNMFLN